MIILHKLVKDELSPVLLSSRTNLQVLVLEPQVLDLSLKSLSLNLKSLSSNLKSLTTALLITGVLGTALGFDLDKWLDIFQI